MNLVTPKFLAEIINDATQRAVINCFLTERRVLRVQARTGQDINLLYVHEGEIIEGGVVAAQNGIYCFAEGKPPRYLCPVSEFAEYYLSRREDLFIPPSYVMHKAIVEEFKSDERMYGADQYLKRLVAQSCSFDATAVLGKHPAELYLIGPLFFRLFPVDRFDLLLWPHTDTKTVVFDVSFGKLSSDKMRYVMDFLVNEKVGFSPTGHYPEILFGKAPPDEDKERIFRKINIHARHSYRPVIVIGDRPPDPDRKFLPNINFVSLAEYLNVLLANGRMLRKEVERMKGIHKIMMETHPR